MTFKLFLFKERKLINVIQKLSISLFSYRQWCLCLLKKSFPFSKFKNISIKLFKVLFLAFMGKGRQGTCTKDTRTKPTGGKIERGRCGWVGWRRNGAWNGDNCNEQQ